MFVYRDQRQYSKHANRQVAYTAIFHSQVATNYTWTGTRKAKIPFNLVQSSSSKYYPPYYLPSRSSTGLFVTKEKKKDLNNDKKISHN